MDWMGEPTSFKTISIDMVNHTRQILEKMIEIQNEQNLRTGGYEAFMKYHGEKVPHVVETFTWGITKCLTPKTLNKPDFEWVKASLIKSPHDFHHLAKIMQLTQTKLDAFVCVTEVMDDRIITHDMLNHKAEWQDAFPLDHFNKRYSKGGKYNITKQPVLKGKSNTQSFDSSCKHCDESQLKEREDSIRSDTLESEELFATLFGRANWLAMKAPSLAPAERKQEGKEQKSEERPEESTPPPFVSSKRYEASSIKMNPYLLKIDVTTIINLNLSHSNMDDFGANIVANLLKRGSLPNLKYLDVSDNNITPPGEGFFARALKNEAVQDIIITIKKYSTDLGQQVIRPALKEFIEYAGKHGVDITNLVTNKGAVEYLKDGGKIVGNLILGYGKCTYKVIEVLTLDLTAPGLTVDYLIEKSGKGALKKANFQLCIAMETYDAFVSPEGVDLAIQAIELLGE